MHEFYPLKKKLLAYSALSAGIIALTSEKSSAQIIYTNISPDYISPDSEWTYILDLNNDGIFDFNFKRKITPQLAFSTSLGSQYLICGRTSVIISGYGNNKIFGSSAYAFDQGQAIFPVFSTSLYQNAPLISYDCDYTGASGGICNCNFVGNWKNVSDKFVGLQIDDGISNFYGWARLSVVTGTQVTIKDYAVNMSPNQPILAGQVPVCNDSHEPNNSYSQATSMQVNQNYMGLINPQGDVDWFRFHSGNQEPNVRITLFNLPKNYNIQLYTLNGNKIGQSQNSGTTADTIIFNGLQPGNYYVKVIPKNNVYSANLCYSLKVETNSNPWKIEQNSENDLPDLQQFELYPNPAFDQLNITSLGEQINTVGCAIFNLIGQQVSEQKEIMLDENFNSTIDISNLSAGEYFLQIKFDSGIEVKKFMVMK